MEKYVAFFTNIFVITVSFLTILEQRKYIRRLQNEILKYEIEKLMEAGKINVKNQN